MKRLFRMLILFSVLALLPACRSGNFSSSEETVRKARIVSVSSDAPENKARYGKTFWIVAADRNEYNEECKKYLENGLVHLGFRMAPSMEKADFLVEFSYEWMDRRRRDTSVHIRLIRNNSKRDLLWTATSRCSSRKDVEIRGFLPGLTAGALLFVGRSTHSRTKLANYPAMVLAVEGK